MKNLATLNNGHDQALTFEARLDLVRREADEAHAADIAKAAAAFNERLVQFVLYRADAVLEAMLRKPG
jgi:hypothetical protein